MSVKRQIDVRKQKSLSPQKSFRFCLKGIMHRLLRSMLTLAVVVMAVAFFMALLAESVLLRSTAAGVDNEIFEQREAALLLNLLYSKPNEQRIASYLAEAKTPEMLKQYAAIGDMSLEDITELAENARMERTYHRFFDGMGIGKRRILIKKHTGPAIFKYLAEDEVWKDFLDQLKPLRDLKMPTSPEKFRVFIDNYDSYTARLKKLHSSWHKKVSELTEATNELTGGKKVDIWLCDVSDEQLAQWQELATSKGFTLQAGKLSRIQELLRMSNRRIAIAKTLSTSDKRSAWKKTFRKSPTTDKKMLLLASPEVVKILDNKYTLEQLTEVVEVVKRENSLNTAADKLAVKLEKSTGSILSGRQMFLLIISFVVCMVGISNAMLMAITERFREIATMKCLGATDGFILTQFLIEAGFQGVVGGVVGMLIGFVLAVLKNSLIFGSYIFVYFPFGEVTLAGIVAIVVGVILAMFASVYPSWAASRMAPMEAMRVE